MPTPLVVAVGCGAGSAFAAKQLLATLPSARPFVLILLDSVGELDAATLDAPEGPRVHAAVAGAEVVAGQTYLVGPGFDVEVHDGSLGVFPAHDDPAPIDRAFRTLSAATRGACAGIVLSGAGADGAIGLKRIKEDGGLTIVLDPTEAPLDGMPRAAIATGLIDLVLGADAIGPRLGPLAARLGQSPVDDARPGEEPPHDTLRDILAFVRVRSGHDFHSYKRATLLRRIARRMQVAQVDSLTEYVGYLRDSPNELAALLRDFMISVTNFFRDPEAFSALERNVLPRIFARREPNVQVRIWVAACATGEEAYSLAILCAEQAALLDAPPSIQIFATDIDLEAVAEARAGIYPRTIESDVSEQRLERFFVKEPGGLYRVKKDIREMVLFSAHNVLRDPPFSKLDLVTCRNLLIYLSREGQERVLGLVHFGLRPDGFLMVGSSESAESTSMLFSQVDVKHRVYARRASSTSIAFAQTLATARWDPPLVVRTTGTAERSVSFGDLHHRLVEHYAPPSVLVNDELEVVHVSEHAGRYLTLGGGEPTRNLVQLLPEAMRLDARAAIYAAQQSEGVAQSRTVAADIEGEMRQVTISARAVQLLDPAHRMLLVTFDELPASAPTAAPEPAIQGTVEPVVRQLEAELHRTRDHLRGTVEQYETSVEELKASNEELHAINEELRSATEELETSKEELQSVNEELTTLNSELKDKIDEVSRAQADLQNLMSSTEIGVVFLDRSMRIKRFTPRAQDVFNIIQTDVGRPIAHVTHQLEGIDFATEPALVLGHLHTIERQVRSKSGATYLARLHPYRSMEDRIEGVVLTFLDITQLKSAEDSLRTRDDLLRLAERAAEAGYWEIETGTFTTRLSEGYQRLFGLVSSPAMPFEAWLSRIDVRDRVRARTALEAAARRGTEVDLELRVEDPVRGERWIWHSGRLDADRSRLTGVAIDVTGRRTIEAALRRSEERFRVALSAAPVVMLAQDRELRFTWGYGFGAELDVARRRASEVVLAAEAPALDALVRSVLESGAGHRSELVLSFSGRGKRTWDVSVEPLREDDRVVGATSTAVDVTASGEAQAALREADRQKDEFLATLAHELRNPLAPLRSGLDLQKLAGNDLALVALARQKMDRQLSQIVRLVDDLMDVGRISTGRLTLRLEDVAVASAVEHAVETTRPAFEALRHRLEVDVVDAGLHLQADPVRLAQVLSNVLQNAAKYTRAGGHVRLAAARVGDVVEIRVKDDGIGIEPEVLGRVFEMFARGSDASDRVAGGLGIGLSLVKKLVELHRGTVEVASEGRGRGTEVVIRLPASDEKRIRHVAAPAARESGSFVARRVLVVDDDVDVRDMVAEVMAHLGHTVLRAEDGASALACLAAEEIDLVLLDISLPDMNGRQVAERARALPSGAGLTIVATTGWELDEGPAAALFDAQLRKPVEVATLERLASELVPRPRGKTPRT